MPARVRLFPSPSFRVACLVLVAVTACAQHRPARAANPISRRIPIAGDTVTLGNRWTNVANHGKSRRGTTVALVDGSAVGADEVLVTCSADSVVRKITLVYSSGRDFDAVLRGLRARFGPPTDSGHVRTTNSQSEIWIWRDAQTEFTYVHRTSTRSAPSGMGVLAELSATSAARAGAGAAK